MLGLASVVYFAEQLHPLAGELVAEWTEWNENLSLNSLPNIIQAGENGITSYRNPNHLFQELHTNTGSDGIC